MEFWPEFLASSTGKEFVAGGFGGTAGIISGYPLDTLRVMQQNSFNTASAFSILRNVVANEGPTALYRGMAAPLASVTFQVSLFFFFFFYFHPSIYTRFLSVTVSLKQTCFAIRLVTWVRGYYIPLYPSRARPQPTTILDFWPVL